ncbi:Phosphatidylinositol 3-kinase regulatory subunit alpha [Fasciola hepatica]|uniref:Phosphatidylinositol 3-kinase regulatory subunit alpha n=1 Tax=Fasciola hepatica TaxID=6192 RepID=A0A4E0RG81_FASHE|nr:Phosphatidylinositol 3-kinase regulatory subunit alpha [Fasciola hepatica]
MLSTPSQVKPKNADSPDETQLSPPITSRIRCLSARCPSSHPHGAQSDLDARPLSQPVDTNVLQGELDHSWRPHRLVRVSVSYPRLCALCQDYVISPRCVIYQCSQCKVLLHAVCAKQSVRTNRPPCRRVEEQITGSQTADPSAVAVTDPDSSTVPNTRCSTSEQPLNQWSGSQVAHWLTVVGLSRFVMLFLRKKVDGNLLVQLAPESPQLNQVVDPFARQALRRAILALNGTQPMAGEEPTIQFADDSPNLPSLDDDVGSGPSIHTPTAFTPMLEHTFRISSFTQEVACVVCGLPLLGLFRQGFQCKTCGMIFHRVCKALDTAPPCSNAPPSIGESEIKDDGELLETLNYAHLPRRLIPYKSNYFAVALEDQPLDPNTQVPMFLLTCTSQIERIASESLTEAEKNPASQPVDLVSVYQQSASASTLAELYNTFAFRLPLLESEPLDVVRLAQLLKAFLRDLPDAVVPEQHYQAFCALAIKTDDADRTRAVHEFLAALPQPHRICLCHVMKHLDFVWSHQRKLRDYLNANDPDHGLNQLENANTPAPSSSSGTSLSVPTWCRVQNHHLTRPNNWLLVFRQILVRPPWHLISHIATQLGAHLQALNCIFYALATSQPPPTPTRRSSPSSPAVFRPRLPSAISGTFAGMSARRTTFDTEYEAVNMPSPTVSQCAPPGPTVNTPPTPRSVAANKRDLHTREWYWGDVTQAEVREIMDGLADGYFLVRDASSRSAGAFTLAVRWRGENKLNRIYHRGDYFGVVDPPAPVFRLVSELIDYYRTHTPKPGEHVGMQLLWPISHRYHQVLRSPSQPSRVSAPPSPTGIASPTFGVDDSDLINTTERSSLIDSPLSNSIDPGLPVPKRQLFSELFRTGAKLAECESRFGKLVDAMSKAVAAKEEAVNLLKGEQKLREWLTAQLQRLNEYSELREESQLVVHRAQLTERLREVEGQILKNTEERGIHSSQYRELAEKQVCMMLERRKLRRQAQEIRRDLKNQGVQEEAIFNRYGGTRPLPGDLLDRPNKDRQFNSLPRTNTPRSTSPEKPPVPGLVPSQPFRNRSSSSALIVPSDIWSRSAWFVRSVTREQVEEVLASKPPGTFLIRHATDGRRLALGVRLASSVQHCLIYQENGKYGFVKSSCSFDTLEDLVRYYHTNSLSQHNPLLNTTLRYPVNST